MTTTTVKPKLRLPVKSETDMPRNNEVKFDIEQLVNMIVTYTAHSKLEARHLISSVVTRDNSHPITDILEWCTYLKEVELAQELINKVRVGNAMVQKDADGKWHETVLEKPTSKDTTEEA